jgi:hypothetical protein
MSANTSGMISILIKQASEGKELNEAGQAYIRTSKENASYAEQVYWNEFSGHLSTIVRTSIMMQKLITQQKNIDEIDEGSLCLFAQTSSGISLSKADSAYLEASGMIGLTPDIIEDLNKRAEAIRQIYLLEKKFYE